jgi:hypothetical protein
MSNLATANMNRDPLGTMTHDLTVFARASISHISAYKPEVQAVAAAERNHALSLLTKIFEKLTKEQQLGLTMSETVTVTAGEADDTEAATELTIPAHTRLIFLKPGVVARDTTEWTASISDAEAPVTLTSAVIIDAVAAGGVLDIAQSRGSA